jgi:prepilin-type N-terminal cleavage/methylation domain-containing protein
MKSLGAFTLIELLVSMVLSSLVISMAYEVYHRSEISFKETFDQYCRTNDLLQLQILLNRDCSNAWLVTNVDDQIQVECLNHQMINYSVLGDKMVRQQKSTIDTFNVGKIEYQPVYLFNKPPILEQIELTIENRRSLTQHIVIHMFYTDKVKFEITKSGKIKEEINVD